MKHTVKLDPMKGISIQPCGGQVVITLTTFGVPAIEQRLTPDQAHVIGTALIQSADDAGLERSSQAQGLHAL